MNIKLKDQIIGAAIFSQFMALPLSMFLTITEYYHISLSRSPRPRTFAQLDTAQDIFIFWFPRWQWTTIVILLYCLWNFNRRKKTNPFLQRKLKFLERIAHHYNGRIQHNSVHFQFESLPFFITVADPQGSHQNSSNSYFSHSLPGYFSIACGADPAEIKDHQILASFHTEKQLDGHPQRNLLRGVFQVGFTDMEIGRDFVEIRKSNIVLSEEVILSLQKLTYQLVPLIARIQKEFSRPD